MSELLPRGSRRVVCLLLGALVSQASAKIKDAAARGFEVSASGEARDVTAQLGRFEAEGGGTASLEKTVQRHEPQGVVASSAVEMHAGDDDHKYTFTEALADKLVKVGDELKQDIETGKAASAQTLDGDTKLATQAFELFGDAKHVMGLKKLDEQAHQLRGHLQAKHQWTTDVLEHIIADFQHMNAAQTMPNTKSEAYNPESADSTGLKAASYTTQEPKEWSFKYTSGGGGGGGSRTVDEEVHTEAHNEVQPVVNTDTRSEVVHNEEVHNEEHHVEAETEAQPETTSKEPVETEPVMKQAATTDISSLTGKARNDALLKCQALVVAGQTQTFTRQGEGKTQSRTYINADTTDKLFFYLQQTNEKGGHWKMRLGGKEQEETPPEKISCKV